MRQLLAGFTSLLVFVTFLSCQKEVSLEYGDPATGSLRIEANGDCRDKSVAGSYAVNKTINDSNFIEVSVAVVRPGPYTIYTDTVNGYSFKATGTFNAAGNNTVRLKGTGRPIAAGTDGFTVVFDSSFCFVEITVLPAGSTGGLATFTLQGAGSACGNFAPQGTYYKDTTLDSRHKVQFQVNVSTVGTYTIRTDTVNGYYFLKTATFGATGLQTVTLDGAGKPLAIGTNTFTVKTGTQTCTFPITVLAGGTTPPGSCGTANGTYTAGTPLTTSNTISITHNYDAAGTYTVSAGAAVNGYSFSGTTVSVTAPGNQTFTLNGTGTPTAAGTNTFTVNFGDGTTCTFTVTVNPATTTTNTDYFPVTLNSYWTYDYDDGSGTVDTFKRTNTGPVTISGRVYQKFLVSDGFTGEFFYRKDAATGFYYEYFDTTGTAAGSGIVFTSANTTPLELQFMRNTLTTNATWNNDFPITFNGVPMTLRFKYTCTAANTTATISGNNFTNVHKVTMQLQVNPGTGFQDAGDLEEFWYARGVGLIYSNDGDTPPIIWNLRYRLVN